MAAADRSPAVIAYDGSDAARRAIEAAHRLVGDRPAVVVSVWESTAAAAPASLIAVPAGVAREAYERLDAEAESHAAGIASEGARLWRELGGDATETTLLAHGNVWSTIVRYAEEHAAAVVVVGSRGRSGVQSALLGSVSNGVVHHCECPVLVVRPERPG